MKLQLITLALVASATAALKAVVTPQQRAKLEASRRDILDHAAGILAGCALVGSPAAVLAEARPMYLTEPTAEFKANEERAMEFKRQQLQIKKQFLEVLDKLLNERDDEDAMVSELRTMQKMIVQTEGLPLGIKKDDLYKQIRSKKAKGYWPTNVEIAYQSLKNEVIFQQSPDSTNKEEGSPY